MGQKYASHHSFPGDATKYPCCFLNMENECRSPDFGHLYRFGQLRNGVFTTVIEERDRAIWSEECLRCILLRGVYPSVQDSGGA